VRVRRSWERGHYRVSDGGYQRALYLMAETLPPFPHRGEPSASCRPSLGGQCWDGAPTLHRWCGQRHQRVAQRLRLTGHRLDLALAVLGFIGVQPLLDVCAAMLQQAIDQTRQLVGGSRN